MFRTKKLFLLPLFLFVFSAFHASAQEYTVVPLIIDHKVEVRSIESDTITVKNNSQAKIEAFPTVNNVSLGENGGIESFITPSMSDRTASLTSWLEISRKALEINPGESASATLTLRMNPNAVPGVYHALVSFPTGRNRDEAEAKVKAGGVPGVIVNVTVEKKTTEFMALSGFKVERFILSEDNESVTYLVDNTGDTDMLPTGDILIYNQKGEEVGTIPINSEKKTIKAGEKETFKAKVPVGGLVGKYKAYLSMQYGNTQRAQLQDTAFFYVVPWKKLLILFGGMLLVAIALSIFVHRRYGGAVEEDDADYLPFDVKDSVSEAKHHDIDMKMRL